jgi:hypothetical protein
MTKYRLVSIIGVLGLVALFVWIFPAHLLMADDPYCFAKPCEIEGKNCVCCLVTIGTISCTPCGQVECPKEN